MNEELKPCPTCGKPPIQFGVLNAYRCEKCAKNSGWMSEKDWNTRPIEDGLRGELETMKEAVRTLLEVLPDAQRGEDWDWAWNELVAPSQELVKTARRIGELSIVQKEK